jgi:hypothetical protein
MNNRHDPLNSAETADATGKGQRANATGNAADTAATTATGKAQGQRLDGDNLQDVLDSGANAWRVGRQQFFTPHPLAEVLMLPLPSARQSFVDLTMGAGALLIASGARDLYGIDIDSRLARKPTANVNGGRPEQGEGPHTRSRDSSQAQNDKQQSWHTACADLTKFYPLLREIDWRFDLCGLNPPFSVRWHRKNLIGLVDSKCEAVRDTFGQRDVASRFGGRRVHIDSTLATFLIALDRMTERGEGFLICSEPAAHKIIATPAGKHVWLHLTIKEDENPDPRSNCVFGKNVRPFDVAVLYFARSHSKAGPVKLSASPCGGGRVACAAGTAASTADATARALSGIVRQRQLLRKGLSIFNNHDFCPLTRELWHAAKEEWLRVNRRDAESNYNIWLRKDGTIWRHLTPFQSWSGKIPRDKAEALNSLAGQTPMSLVVQKATRLALLEAIGKSSAQSDATSRCPWRVDPALVAAVEKAIGEYHAQRAPFYPLNEVQRLGYLDEEDMIVCKRDGLNGFKKGDICPISSETIDIERHEKRLNLVGKSEDVSFQGKELAFYIEDANGDKHSFCGVPPDQVQARTGSSQTRYVDTSLTANDSRAAARRHDLQALIRHFAIPDVADVAQINPDRYNDFVDQIRAIENAVNKRTAA